jgi:hypothetical protein
LNFQRFGNLLNINGGKYANDELAIVTISIAEKLHVVDGEMSTGSSVAATVSCENVMLS